MPKQNKKPNKEQQKYEDEIKALEDSEQRKWANQALCLTHYCLQHSRDRGNKVVQESGMLAWNSDTLEMAYSKLVEEGRELGLTELRAYKRLVEIGESLDYGVGEFGDRVKLEFLKPEQSGEVPRLSVTYDNPWPSLD